MANTSDVEVFLTELPKMIQTGRKHLAEAKSNMKTIGDNLNYLPTRFLDEIALIEGVSCHCDGMTQDGTRVAMVEYRWEDYYRKIGELYFDGVVVRCALA